jgi:hypothetical protein
MRGRFVSLAMGLLLLSAPVVADEKSDAADILAARKFAEPVLGKQCDFGYDQQGVPEGENLVYRLTYRSKGQDQDSPDYKRTLVQLACYAAAYNFSSVYLLRNDDEGEGGWELLSFAEPLADFDYADEYFSKLKAPPKVTGYSTSTQLQNSEFDEASKTITESAKWRGVGDSWSIGEWQFDEGAFVLKRYEIDPTQVPPEDQETDPNHPESYVLFGDPRPKEE